MLLRCPPRRIVPCRLNGRGVMRFPTLPSSSRWFFCPRGAIVHCSFNIPSDVSADLDRIDTGPSFTNQNVMKRVLIADDLEDQRELYVTSLALAGFVVDEAADGGQVIDVVTNHRPDVIVLDLGMPVLDGLQVCRRLKANDRTAAIPIIIVTGNTLPGVRETVERAGADGFLARPCSPDTLVAAIRQHTGEAAGGALQVPYPAGNVSGGKPRREVLIRPARRADVLAGLAVPSTRLNGVADASVDQHQKLVRGLMRPAIAGVSPRAVEDWFRQRVDFKVVLPDLKNPKITLVGARMSRLANADAAVIDYRLDHHRVSLFIIPEEAYNRLALAENPGFKPVQRRGYDVIIWRHGATGYTIVSEIGVRACPVCHSPDAQ